VPIARTGSSLAGYRLIELGGEGGMGRVYRAVQPGTERVVALKVIRPELASDPGFRERFEVESRLAAAVDHPNVTPVYEAGEADDVLYVAMRWVEGRDLRRLLAAEGALEPERAVALLEQLAAGLDAAHAGGLIHRDIKPGNVLLEGEHAFLSDFGLARTSSGGESMTQAAGLVGTVDYLAPELVDGGTATVASDVYALGCVLFQMLTGSVPFPADGLVAKLNARVQGEAPAPSALRPELPRGFDAVLARALAREPGRRPRTAGALAEAARRALRTAPAQAPRRGRKRIAMLAAGGVAVAAIVVAAVLALSGGSGHDSTKAPPNGRTLPAAASLPACGDLLTAPPGDCRNSGGEIDVLTTAGRTAQMATMDFGVTKAVQSEAIVEPTTKDRVTAPPGQRFVVLEAIVANQLASAQVFEPDQFAGRQVALYIYDDQGNRLAPHGPDFADYTEQNLPATALVPLSLAGMRLPPPRAIDVPLSGALVFSYPLAELRKAETMVLLVRELGDAKRKEESIGVVRLPAAKAKVEGTYEGAGI
jgi:predicted Ser/Thr protein kinase